jgi:hypothetical protein
MAGSSAHRDAHIEVQSSVQKLVVLRPFITAGHQAMWHSSRGVVLSKVSRQEAVPSDCHLHYLQAVSGMVIVVYECTTTRVMHSH